jgi:hypothetical protein
MVVKRVKSCSQNRCSNKGPYTRGMCGTHYKHWLRDAKAAGEYEPLHQDRVGHSCKECGSPEVLARGLCSACYQSDRYEPRPHHEIDLSPDGWRAIYDFPDYEITEFGRVRNSRGWILTPSPNSSGYLRVALRRAGKSVQPSIHQLVLQTYVGPRPEGKDHCCHRDGDKLNNHVSNLYWGTAAENSADAIRHGSMRKNRPTACGRGHEYVDGSYWVRNNGTRTCKECQRIRYAENRRGAA